MEVSGGHPRGEVEGGDVLMGADAVRRLLELADDRTMIRGEGDAVTVYVSDGDRRRRITLTVGSHDLTPIYPPPPADLSEDEAREQGLDLYLSREWMLRQLVRHKTVKGVSDAAGYTVEAVKHYRTAHGISSASEEIIRFEWASGRYAKQSDLADALGVCKARVSRIVGDARSVELGVRIRELIVEGQSNNNIADTLIREGSRKTRERLIDLIRSTRLRSGDV